MDITSLKPIRAGLLNHFREQRNFTRINWHFAYICNYNCDYCFSRGNRKRHVDHTKKELMDAAVKIARLREKLYLMLIGMEPTASKYYLDILEALKGEVSPKATLDTMTNLSRNISYLEKVKKRAPDMKWQISVHFNHAKADATYDKIKYLIENFPNVHAALMFHPEFRDEMIKLYDMLLPHCNQTNFDMSVNMVRSRETKFQKFDERYTQADYDFVNRSKTEIKSRSVLDVTQESKIQDCNLDQGFFVDFKDENDKYYRYITDVQDAIHKDILKFNNFYCYNDFRWILNVKGDLEVMPCTVGLTDQKSFNVFTDEITSETLKPQVYVCPKERCLCGPHTSFPKFIDYKYAPVHVGGDSKFHVDTIKVEKLTSDSFCEE